jgi:UDP-3-O-[3-hydroxymyristoyl] N-acetylglucosamine deacetylase
MKKGCTIMFQKTFARSASISGIGLHSGVVTSVELHPAATSSGVVVQIGDGPQARIETLSVQKTPRCTRLIDAAGNILDTAEHLLAALATSQISNCVLKFSGPEVPILDGCSSEWLKLMEAAVLVEQPVEAAYLVVTRPFTYREGVSEYSAKPGADRINVEIDFPHPAIAFQHITVHRADFRSLASARTFVLEEDVARLKAAGLAHGGSLDNALVIGAGGPINPEGFRFPDECVRHKALDFIGDLYVCGFPIVGDLSVSKPGHSANAGFLSALLASDCIEIVMAHELSEAA